MSAVTLDWMTSALRKHGSLEHYVVFIVSVQTGQQVPSILIGAKHGGAGQDSTKHVMDPFLHSHFVQGSLFHLSLVVRVLSVSSVQSVLLNRDSSFLICFLRLVIVFCISRTNSLKSLTSGIFFGCSVLEVAFILSGELETSLVKRESWGFSPL